MKLSANFHLSEFVSSQTAARRRLDNAPPRDVIDRLTEWCKHIGEPVRRKFGPVHVNSGYRSPKVNAAVGGARNSQHVTGEAVDIEVPGVSNHTVAAWIRDNCDFDQLILEFYTPGQPSSGWVHVSYRKGGNRKQVLTAARVRTLGRLRTVYKEGLVK
jgi:zinc D-Ala-D-Ala carboxypeptidase